MAGCSMASAASGFVIKVSQLNSNTNTPSKSIVLPLTSSKNNRLVVRAAEEAAAPATTAPAKTEAPKAAKPPPIGPKRGTKVCISTR